MNDEREPAACSLALTVSKELVTEIAEIAAQIAIDQLNTITAAPELMTVHEAADYMRCSRQRIYDLTSAGRIPRLKDGSRTLIERTDIDAHLRRVAPALPLRCDPALEDVSRSERATPSS